MPPKEDPGTNTVEPFGVVKHWNSGVPHGMVLSLGGPPKLEPAELASPEPLPLLRGLLPADGGPPELLLPFPAGVPPELVPPPLPLGGAPGTPLFARETPDGSGWTCAAVVRPVVSVLAPARPVALFKLTVRFFRPWNSDELLLLSLVDAGGPAWACAGATNTTQSSNPAEMALAS